MLYIGSVIERLIVSPCVVKCRNWSASGKHRENTSLSECAVNFFILKVPLRHPESHPAPTLRIAGEIFDVNLVFTFPVRAWGGDDGFHLEGGEPYIAGRPVMARATINDVIQTL